MISPFLNLFLLYYIFYHFTITIAFCYQILLILDINLAVSERKVKIRIIKDPGGEAPEFVRNAWIGLVLTLDRDSPQPSKQIACNVASGEALLDPLSVYTVNSGHAIGVLAAAKASVEVRTWWFVNTPYMIHPEMSLLFPVECCEVLSDDDAVKRIEIDSSDISDDYDGPL
jgi:hypothetical protein